MTSTQKRWFEWPLLIAFLWLYQSLELSLFQLPSNLGSISLIPILMAYTALTRDWSKHFFLSLFFCFMGSFSTAVAAGIFIASALWTALIMKLVVMAFALEGRKPFSTLAVGCFVLFKVLRIFLLVSTGLRQPFFHNVIATILGMGITGALAWTLFPHLVKWDIYFEHEADGAREVNPNVLR
jgi:hypothetical protein